MKQFDDRRPDTSAEERNYYRSVRIRRSVILWLDKNVGESWAELMDMADECGNEGKPLPFSTITAYRWIHQFTARNFAFGIRPDRTDNNAYWQVYRRRPLRMRDFVRWGIKPPKRFEE